MIPLTSELARNTEILEMLRDHLPPTAEGVRAKLCLMVTIEKGWQNKNFKYLEHQLQFLLSAHEGPT